MCQLGDQTPPSRVYMSDQLSSNLRNCPPPLQPLYDNQILVLECRDKHFLYNINGLGSESQHRGQNPIFIVNSRINYVFIFIFYQKALLSVLLALRRSSAAIE